MSLHRCKLCLRYGGFRSDRRSPNEILYDRMKTAVIGEAGGSIVYNRALIDFARHYGYQPKACRPYRAKTKGKVERPYRYIREDFFLARSFRNLDDLNAQLGYWLDSVANPRVHASTQRVVNEAFAEEKPHLKTLPLAPFRSVLKLERRVSHEGMVSVGSVCCHVPDAIRKRNVDLHVARRWYGSLTKRIAIVRPATAPGRLLRGNVTGISASTLHSIATVVPPVPNLNPSSSLVLPPLQQAPVSPAPGVGDVSRGLYPVARLILGRVFRHKPCLPYYLPPIGQDLRLTIVSTDENASQNENGEAITANEHGLDAIRDMFARTTGLLDAATEG